MFTHGCNYPWSTDGVTVFYGLDFGANVWGSHLGVSTRRAAIEHDFQQMAALGFTVVRWFVFCDGRAGIVYDDGGLPTGPDDYLVADLDAGLEIARDAGIRLVLVLLDHRWMFDTVHDMIADPVSGAVLEGVLAEGRAPVLLTQRGHDALLTALFVPLLRRYGHDGERPDLASTIFAWELVNEPDCFIEEWEADLSSHVKRPVPFATLASLVDRFSKAVHAHTPALVTIGGARARNLWAWDDDDLGLDLLQVHQYPDARHPQRDDNLFGTPRTALGLRRDVILGEFPGDAVAQHPTGASPVPISLEEYLEFALAEGYAGAWPWSFSGTDGYGRMPIAPLRQFGRRHPELVNSRFELT